MADNLIVWTAAKEVSSAITSIVTTYRTLRTVKKQESIMLKEKIRAFQTIARIKNMGEIARAMVDEIAKMQAYIDRQNLSPIALEYAMNYLAQLNEALKNNMEVYINGV